jgi:hypothetical protein
MAPAWPLLGFAQISALRHHNPSVPVMPNTFLSTFSDEEIIASSGITRDIFIKVYNKYCGSHTPINR